MPRGISVVELVVVLALVGVLTMLVAPRWEPLRDGLAVDRATAEVATFYHTARYAAILRSQMVRMEVGDAMLRAVYEGIRDSTFLQGPGPARLGVTLEASRSTIRIGPNGLGYGAANTRLVLRRGDAADTLTTSRLGRLKRW